MNRVQMLFFSHLALEFPDEVAQFLARFRNGSGEAHSVELHVAENRADFLRKLPDAEIVLSSPLSEDTVCRAEKLRFHVIPFAGVNRVPLDLYRERGVRLANSHGNAEVVAERAVALALAAAGRLVEFHRGLADGYWHRRDDEVHPFCYWRSLRGACVAMVGAGAIGTATARLLAPLVGEIRAFRRFADDADRSRGTDSPFTVETADLAEAMTAADLVVGALPLTDATRGIIAPALLAATNRAVFVNVSRAEIVDESVLYDALQTGVLGAAGLDVWYRHPSPFWENVLPSDKPFHELSNVVLSPHAGSHTVEGKLGQLTGAFNAIAAYLRGTTVQSEVPLERGY